MRESAAVAQHLNKFRRDGFQDVFMEVKPNGRRVTYHEDWHRENPHLKLFDGDGNEISINYEEIDEALNPEKAPPKLRPAPPKQVDDRDYGHMHWTQLRKIVIERGGEWSTVDQGIAYLKALDAEEDAA